MIKRLLLLIGLAAAGAAAAAPIYRCGPDGRTYSQTPCADGTVVESTDNRTAAQRAEARRVLAAERQAAAELERERREASKTASGAVLTPTSAVPIASAPAGRELKPAKGKAAAAKDAVTANSAAR